MKILIVKLSSLGDVVHAMPALQDLRRALPQAQIDWVVEEAFAPLVARCDGVHRVIPCAMRRWRKSPLSAATRQQWDAFRQQLQAQAYDAVLDLQGLGKSALVAWLARLSAGGRRYAMANRTDGSSYEAATRWVADVAIPLAPHVHAVPRARLLCAQALGYSVEGAPRYGLRGKSGPSGPPERPTVALVHGSSRADKQWPLAHWVDIGRRLNHAGYAVALVQGNAPERAQAEAIAAQLVDARVWPTLALDAVLDALACSSGVIGVDSGLSHIAVALDLPHVQLYNFDTAWRTGPLDAPHQCSVYAAPCPTPDAVWAAWLRVAPFR